jgi:CheY-like chemotaxis protein
LGLSVVHGIVQAHQGNVEIRSALEQGTTVTILLPASSARPDEAAQPEAAQGEGERVMYVDDEEALVFLMGRALAKMGYTVSGFDDPDAALRAFRSQPDQFDVVVTDVSMPRMSGPDLAAQLRKIRPDVPIIMTSGYLRSEDIEAAKRLGINQLIYKANTIDELGAALRKEISTHARPRSEESTPSGSSR